MTPIESLSASRKGDDDNLYLIASLQRLRQKADRSDPGEHFLIEATRAGSTLPSDAWSQL